jgi:hypothetical protein
MSRLRAPSRLEKEAELILLFEVDLRALGIEPRIRKEWLASARKNIGTANEPGGITALRAVLAVMRGEAKLEDIRRGWRPR